MNIRSVYPARLTILLALSNFMPSLGLARPQIAYTLSMPEPVTHQFHVEVAISDWQGKTIDFVMPSWSPGRYAIYDFAKNVSQERSEAASGGKLPVERIDLNTWRVKTGGQGTIRFAYRVYANTLSGTFSQLNDAHANVNGASVFVYVKGQKQRPVTLKVQPYGNWRVATGLGDRGDNHFSAPDYDVLIDSPIEISDFLERRFEVEGKQHQVVIHDNGRLENVDSLVTVLRLVVESARRLIGSLPYERYVFLYHFWPSAATGDGMEHLNSTQIIQRLHLADATSEDWEGIQYLAAHEYFHLWNVKRLRPAGFGPYDYTHPIDTRNLWIAEGLTTYYAYLICTRSGLWSESQMLRRMAKQINYLAEMPGRRLTSLEYSGLLTWFHIRSTRPLDDTNLHHTQYSYYVKGMLVGWLLDMEIRKRTKGERSLDDVMRALYRRFYERPSDSYYLRGKGFTAAEFQQAAARMAGADLSDFFNRFVRGTDELDYTACSTHVGLVVAPDTSETSPWLGWELDDQAEGSHRITDVLPGSAAQQAGLDRGDEILALDDRTLGSFSWSAFWDGPQPGDTVTVTFFRRDLLQQTRLLVPEETRPRFVIQDADSIDEATRTNRKAWLSWP